MPQTDLRVTEHTDLSTRGIIQALTDSNPGAMSVLLQWLEKDSLALIAMLTCLDLKHLYDDQIWEVYLLCGKDIDRFIYHVQMELPDQLTGHHATSGPYIGQVDEEFYAKRKFGKPGSFWALEHPPAETDYAYPIR
ncbi:MAG TPA: hypothetical protein VGE30_00680 [Candidatus Saccharimonadales bacterium]